MQQYRGVDLKCVWQNCLLKGIWREMMIKKVFSEKCSKDNKLKSLNNYVFKIKNEVKKWSEWRSICKKICWLRLRFWWYFCVSFILPISRQCSAMIFGITISDWVWINILVIIYIGPAESLPIIFRALCCKFRVTL